MLLVCAGCAKNNQTPSSSSSGARSDNFELKLGYDPEHPPYTFLGDYNQIIGFDIDLAKEVCRLKGWSFKPVEIEWSDKLSALNSGSIDCVWSALTMEGREGSYTFSKPYMENEQVIVVEEDSNINTLADLEGKIIITQTDSAAYEALTEGERASLGKSLASLPIVLNYDRAFQQLDTDYIDAVACDLSIAKYHIAQKPSRYKILSEPLSSEHYAVGFAQGNTSLAHEIDEAFQQLKDEGVIDKLCEKYNEYGILRESCLL